MSTPAVRRGDLVEFTDNIHFDYPPADTALVRYGVATEDTDTETMRLFGVRVMLADRTTTQARFVHASGWAGWMPTDLESVYEDIQQSIPDGYAEDEDGYL